MNIQQATPEFNAAMFWADKPIKKYVCTLRCGVETETRIYGASNSDRAAALSLENTDLNPENAVILDIHLASPSELGCVAVTAVNNTPQTVSKEQQLKSQCQRLSTALAQCLGLMEQCEKFHDWPLCNNDPVDSDRWMLITSGAAKILKEGK